MKKNKIFIFALFAISILLCLYGFWNFRYFYHDDSFISLRYVQNFISNQGLVWNPGEIVEGYTNFLYILLLSALSIFTSNLVLLSRIVGASFFIALLGLSYYHYHSKKSLSSFTPFLMIASSFPMIIWAISGMETIMFAFLVFLSIYIFVGLIGNNDNSSKSIYIVTNSIIFALAAMTRPEGIMLFGITVGFLLLNWKRFSISFIAKFALPFLIIWGTYFIWRYNFYGYLLTNTYYAKDGFSLATIGLSINYLFSFLKAPPFMLVALIAIYVYSKIQKQSTSVELRYLTLILSIYTTYIFFTTGDHMPAYRFFVPIIPLIAFLYSMYLERLPNKQSMLFLSFILFGIVVQVLANPTQINRAEERDPAAYIGEIVGHYIDRSFPENSLIALNTAGSTPFYAPNNRYIDMLGLNDTTISHRKAMKIIKGFSFLQGHNKGDGLYVLSRKPDYIILGYAFGNKKGNPRFRSDYDIVNEKEFLDNYQEHTSLIPISSRQKLVSKSNMDTVRFTYYRRNK